MSMPTLSRIEMYEHLWPLSWTLLTNKKRQIDVTYKMGVLTCSYKDAKVPFFTKEMSTAGQGRPYKLSTLDMLEATGFKCNPHQ